MAGYSSPITRKDLAAELGLAASGGTFSTYISRLRSPGLVEVNGAQILLAPALMGGAAGPSWPPSSNAAP